MRKLGAILLLLGIAAALGEIFGLALPTAKWFFEASRDIVFLNLGGFPWFGWLCVLGLLAMGVLGLFYEQLRGPLSPTTRRRIERFKGIRRGYYSLWVLLVLVGLAGLDQIIVGNRALAVNYKGEWTFPAFSRETFTASRFGETGEMARSEVDFRALQTRLQQSGEGRVVMPLIPFASTGDTLPRRSRALDVRDGRCFEPNESERGFSGLASRLYDVASGEQQLRYHYRNGLPDGPAEGWDRNGSAVYRASYARGQLISDSYTGEGTKEDFLASAEARELRQVFYHPAPPLPSQGSWLGTTSQGYDVLAYLFGGLQVNIKAAIIFIPIVYMIGITLGLLMGFFGGTFDLVVQRIIEIFSNVPFLFIVIIISSAVPEAYKGLPVILGILVVFGWMGMTYLMRTAALKEKSREYISSARVIGASTPRIIFRHLLPNSVAIVVTIIPFSIEGLISSLTALDYLGFGLPPRDATWGRLLNDGLSNPSSAPWLVTSTFVVLVSVLILITFVGEAVREAFDPKKFTYYR
jgi:microcin C transport system permease protein